VPTRIVWRGGATTTLEVPVTVGAFTDLSTAADMEQQLCALFAAGHSDVAIAEQLTQQGYRSPKSLQVLPSTVQILRLQHGLMPTRHQSHLRCMAGYLTVPQFARRLGVTSHWVYDRLHNGRIRLAKDRRTGLYLFPHTPSTLEKLQQLQTERQSWVTFEAREAVGSSARRVLPGGNPRRADSPYRNIQSLYRYLAI
jgi:hypothetical protein